MAESVELITEPRQEQGSRAARKLRKAGKLPAVVYGHGEGTASVTLTTEDVDKAIKHGVRVVDLKADGKVQKALIRDVQWDHLGKELLHIDFARVSAADRVVVPVPVHVRGQAPGVTAGGVLDQPIHTLSVECPALSVPEFIRVNVGELQLGGAIHVRELTLPEGVKAMAEPDAIVVIVKSPEEEEAPLPGEGGVAEPEVIGRKAAEGEETEEK